MNGKIGFFKELLKKIAERGNSFDDVVEILKCFVQYACRKSRNFGAVSKNLFSGTYS